jgi:xylulokinase
MHGATFLDSNGKVIRPALLWNDQRTARQCEVIAARVGAGRLREIAGNPVLTGFQSPKILWLSEAEPEAYRRLRHVLLPKDFVRYRLTGGFATDASDAAGTLLLDLKERNWSEEILDALEIPREWLPEVFEGPQVTGRISREGAAGSGLAEGTPVVAGGGDNAAAAVGCGVVRAGTGLVSVGTSGVIFVHSDRLNVDPAGALHAFCHAVPGAYHLMGVVLSAGGGLRWYRDRIAGEAALGASRSGAESYEGLLDQAMTVAPGCEGLYFLPYLAGERTPHRDPYARAAWIGLTLAHGRAHMVRALIEGVGFALRDSLTLVERHGVLPEKLFAVGGGMRSKAWRELLAAQLGLPLQPLAVDEGPAFGAAILAVVGAGVFSDLHQAVDHLVRPEGAPVVADPDLRAVYDGLYRNFARLYPALKQARIWDDRG